MDQKMERMKELVALLNKASELYYQKNTSMMTDYEYDRLYDELVELEKETNMTLSNSPTVNVEPEVSDALEHVEHPAPMLSLSKTKDVDELIDFIGEEKGLLSWKLDGLTIVLTYENGKLASGVTRGNGTIGELVTENVKQFKNIPLTIPYKGRLVLRGEAIIKYSDFMKMNETMGDGSSQYKNPRNLCSGSVRQLDSKVTAKRNVNCVIFALIEADKELSNSKSENFKWLTSLGFEVVESVPVDKANMKDVVREYKEKVKTYDIPSDGLVLTYDNISYGNSLGMTAKFPRHSIAFKWQDETAKTKLINIDWLVSRTGLINPVAIFEPVELEGTIVSRASLHNLSIIKGLKLGVGDEILVYKANMIIPQVASSITKGNHIDIPKQCPVCHGRAEVVVNNDVEYLYCMNDYCPQKLMKKMSLFVSRNAMNMEGISEAILTKFMEEDMIHKNSDLYHLEKYRNQIISFEGFGEKSYDNIIHSIEKSKNVKMANFIYSLGIPDIGFSRAKLICNSYHNDYQKLIHLSFEELSNIDGVGDIIASEWIATFQDSEFLEELNKIKKEIHILDEGKVDSGVLDGKIFVITGSLTHFENRDQLVEYIESLGGKVIKAISSNVDYLINNDVNSSSTKNKKAKELNISIISEDEFLQLCQ